MMEKQFAYCMLHLLVRIDVFVCIHMYTLKAPADFVEKKRW